MHPFGGIFSGEADKLLLEENLNPSEKSVDLAMCGQSQASEIGHLGSNADDAPGLGELTEIVDARMMRGMTT